MGLFNRGPRPAPNRPDPPEPVFDEPLETSITATDERPEPPPAPAQPPAPELPRTPEPPPVNVVPTDEPESEDKRITANEALAPSRSASAGFGGSTGEAPTKRATVISFANQKGGVAK